ncbi:MAG: hypothetical protein AAGM22_08390 [Acidobacteriota bacterium]
MASKIDDVDRAATSGNREMECPRREIYEPEIRPVVWTAGVTAILLLALTACLAISAIGDRQIDPLLGAIGVWTIVPPVWFWGEYFFLYRKHGKPGTLDLFKYGQQVSGAVWLAVLALLTILANAEHLWS